MPLSVTNTLTRKKEVFRFQEPGKVRLYVCGPTVYNYIHVGNARPNVFFDVVRRYLEHSGYHVHHVMNFTDVDDKIIDRARKEGIPSTVIAQKYTEEFLADMKSLGVLPPHVAPKVTDHIPQILALIHRLVEKGSAYVTDNGEVFFSVRGFAPYGKLSGKNIDDLVAGARVEINAKKKDPLDFSLWKPQKSADEPAWPSPWGPGRPGWHIECSAMAMEYLGETLDIHGGGIDLMHPHHENEIAQSEAATGTIFARYWLHNNLLTMHSEKMSKSVGNIFLTRDFITQYGAETLKFMLLSGHYRSPIDFSAKQIRESQAALHRIYSTIRKCEAVLFTKGFPRPDSAEETKLRELIESFSARWHEAMDDDFNTAKVIGQVFDMVRSTNAYLDAKGFKPSEKTPRLVQDFLKQIALVGSILNLFQEKPVDFLHALRLQVLRERSLSREQVEEQIERRKVARQNKDFGEADRIRDLLAQSGVELRDTPSGTEWDVLFS